jgi:hypothetical protein
MLKESGEDPPSLPLDMFYYQREETTVKRSGQHLEKKESQT